MLIVRSHGGVPIRLTDERWNHIAARHPEVSGWRERVLETVSEPDIIQQGDYEELLAIREYAELPLGRYVVVVYRETGPDDGFVLTAYLAGRVSAKGRVIWKR